jgi:hypothetical protein
MSARPTGIPLFGPTTMHRRVGAAEGRPHGRWVLSFDNLSGIPEWFKRWAGAAVHRRRLRSATAVFGPRGAPLRCSAPDHPQTASRNSRCGPT